MGNKGNTQVKVLVSDKLAEEGLGVFRAAHPKVLVDVKVGLKPEELRSIIGTYDGLAVRSSTQVTPEILEAATQLKAIGRAGIGVDNIDVEAASKRGIIVMNTPEGNVVTTAEHAIALMFSLARQLPQATASMKQGKWEKSKFSGREVFGKTLGVVGLGNIGKIVADRGVGLRMKVIAYDPYVTPVKARELGVELVSLEDLLGRADFVTLHVPLVDATRGIIGRSAIEKMKRGAFLINAARGGLVDEQAAADALTSGKLGGAAFDVFVDEPPAKDHPLFRLDNVVLTPHLGASTSEAQVNVSIAVAEQLVAFLTTGAVKYAVNAPTVSAELMASIGPYMRLGRKIGSLAAQIHRGGVREVRMVFEGAKTELPMEPVTVSILTGLLATQLGTLVNEVNAPLIASERGIEMVQQRHSTTRDFANSVALHVTGDEDQTAVVGALFGNDEPRIVSVNGTRLEIVPEGHILLTRHRDRPGMLGKIGTLLGQHSVNISRLALGQVPGQDKIAQAVFSIDGAVGSDVLAGIAAVDGIETVRHLSF